MNNHKLKNKDYRHTDFRETLVMVHEKTMSEFEALQDSLPKRRLDLQSLSGHNRADAAKEIMDIENRTAEVQYLLKAMPYLTKVKIEQNESAEASTVDESGNLGDFFEKKGSVMKGKMYAEYMEACKGVIITSGEPEIMDDPFWCKKCETTKFNDTRAAALICPSCGLSVQYQDDTSTPQYSDTIQILSPFAYQRINHFKEFLAQLQAKNNMTEIPVNVVLAIKKELKKERIVDPADITTVRIRRYLKKLHLNKYYEHVNSITCTISGKTPPRLSVDLEVRFVQMFKEIQAPFEKHCPKERKNFLSYSYTLHKMCQLLGKNDLLEYFPLLKSREKNYVQDCIWKGICSELDWEFISSV